MVKKDSKPSNKFWKYNILDVIEDKIKFQNEIYSVVVTQVKYGETKVEKSEKVANRVLNSIT